MSSSEFAAIRNSVLIRLASREGTDSGHFYGRSGFPMCAVPPLEGVLYVLRFPWVNRQGKTTNGERCLVRVTRGSEKAEEVHHGIARGFGWLFGLLQPCLKAAKVPFLALLLTPFGVHFVRGDAPLWFSIPGVFLGVCALVVAAKFLRRAPAPIPQPLQNTYLTRHL